MKKLLIGLFILGGVIITSTFGSHATLSPTYTPVRPTISTFMSWRSSFPVQCNQIIFSYRVHCYKGNGYTVDAVNNSKTVVTDYSYYNNIKLGYIKTTSPEPYNLKTTTIINGSTLIF